MEKKKYIAGQKELKEWEMKQGRKEERDKGRGERNVFDHNVCYFLLWVVIKNVEKLRT